MKKFLLLLLGALLTLPAIAQTFTYEYMGQTLNYEIIDKTAKTARSVSNYPSTITGEVVFPSFVKYEGIDYTLIEIGMATFYGQAITAVTIPNTVVKIEENAFYQCRNLSQVKLGNSVETIGFYAFGSCAITELTIPSSVKTIGRSAFSSNSKLSKINLGKGVETIEENAFGHCSISNLTIPSSVKTIGSSAFSNCKIEKLFFENGIETIGENAFRDNLLTEVAFPSSVRTIDDQAFSQCFNLSKITFGDSLETIGYMAFLDSKCTELVIPNSVKSIGHSAFNTMSDGSTLEKVILGESLESLGVYAIGGDYEMKSKNIKFLLIKRPQIYSKLPLDNGANIIVPESVLDGYKEEYASDIEKESLQFMSVYFEPELEDNTLIMGRNQTKSFSVALKGAEVTNGFQTDITLPAGLAIATKDGKLDVTLGDGKTASHVLTASKVSGDNEYRIIVYSKKNELFTSGDGMLTIGFTSDATFKGGDIKFSNTTFSIVENESIKTDDVIVTVPSVISVEWVKVTPDKTELNLGKNLQMTAEVGPEEATKKDVVWSSSNTAVATVDANGLVTPVAKGEATILATAADGSGVTGSSIIIVTNYAQSFTFKDKSMRIEEDETKQLEPVFTPANAEELGLLWSSTDASVAYVDSDNVLHTLRPGNVTITAVNEASGLSATIDVEVTAVLYGDANDNGVVTIDDVVSEVSYILEKDPAPFSFKKADVNRDRVVNIIDVSKTVTIIMSANPSAASMRRLINGEHSWQVGMKADEVNVEESGHALMTIDLAEIADITAIQGDITLPAGIRITDIRLAGAQGSDHIVDFAQVGDDVVRFAIYSLSLDRLTENTPMLEVEMDCCHDYVDRYANIDAIYASDTDCKPLNFEPVCVTIKDKFNGVESLNPDNIPANTDVYNLQGICIKRDATADDIKALTPGLYIIGGTKVLVK